MNIKNFYLIKLLTEVVNRLKTKSPKLFVVIQHASLIVFAITGVPQLLNELGIVLPIQFAEIVNKVVGACSILALFIAALPIVDDANVNLPISKKKEEK